MKMNMTDNLLARFKECNQAEHFLKVGSPNLYIGRDDEGYHCFEFRGQFHPVKLIGSKPLAVKQYEKNGTYTLRFSLTQSGLIGCFCAFCDDMITSAVALKNDDEVYKCLADRFKSWKKLFKIDRSKLTEPEIMGLIGELLFLKEKGALKWGMDLALDSWMGPENTRKDFSLENMWVEVKAVNSGKETVRISSIEQLDGAYPGWLYVFFMEKMSPVYDGIKISQLIQTILNTLSVHQKDVFLNKLSSFGYDFSPEYDNLVFRNTDEKCFSILDDFPRLRRDSLPIAIAKAQYDLILSEIEQYQTEF